VVSQRELIMRCWDGLTVGDDAIARCIASLRQLAGRGKDPPFTIETIAGVGYRLVPAPPVDGEGPTAAGRLGAGRIRGLALPLAGAAVVVVAVAAAVLAFGPGRRSGLPTTAIAPIQVLDGGAGAKALAAMLGDDLSGAM